MRARSLLTRAIMITGDSSGTLFLSSRTGLVLPYFDTSSIAKSNIELIVLSLYVLSQVPETPSRVHITINPVDVNNSSIGDGLSSFVDVKTNQYVDFRLPKELFEQSIHLPRRFLVKLVDAERRIALKGPDPVGTSIDPKLTIVRGAAGGSTAPGQPIIEYTYYNYNVAGDYVKDDKIVPDSPSRPGVPSNPGLEPTKLKILFMAANPVHTNRIDLDEELRNLERELKGVLYRDQITLASGHAVRPDDLIRHVRAEEPRVIHFSGHGSKRGIVLRSDDGGCTEVTGASLRRFLDGRGIELLVLNACYTKEQADDIGSVVSAIVGTTDAVDDEAARRFTVAFYRALGNGLSVGDAFRDGGDAVALHGLEDVFWISGDLDLVLLRPPSEKSR